MNDTVEESSNKRRVHLYNNTSGMLATRKDGCLREHNDLSCEHVREFILLYLG
jgi:hypothetical protein